MVAWCSWILRVFGHVTSMARLRVQLLMCANIIFNSKHSSTDVKLNSVQHCSVLFRVTQFCSASLSSVQHCSALSTAFSGSALISLLSAEHSDQCWSALSDAEWVIAELLSSQNGWSMMHNSDQHWSALSLCWSEHVGECKDLPVGIYVILSWQLHS